MNTYRHAALGMSGQEFKKIGHELVDSISSFLDSIRERPVTGSETTETLAGLLGTGSFPDKGRPADELLASTAPLLFNHSLLNGHPRFFGYITSSAAPIGALADMLAAAVNPNVAAAVLSPMASQIERQTIGWLCDLIGVPSNYGGLLVSGGNMANFTAYLAGMTVKSEAAAKRMGGRYDAGRRTVYCSRSTHTWIEKAVKHFGPGKAQLRWVDVDDENRMDNLALENMILEDLDQGFIPMLVSATAGDVSTGAVDNFEAIGVICQRHNLWFHIDGAYGMPAAMLPEMADLFSGIREADSIAMDPHKWLYCPIEAGCTLVKNRNHLLQTFSVRPVYYDFNHAEAPENINYYEYGLQNSRGFRALKVWLALQQAGRSGYERMIREDIALSGYMHSLARQKRGLQAISNSLSITCFRYVPEGWDTEDDEYLNKLNERLRKLLEQQGQVFFSNAVVKGKYCLRGCIVNFRTEQADVDKALELVVARGKKLHRVLRKEVPEQKPA